MGPLKGIRAIELCGIGPGPFCGMMLSDMGADVIAVDRPGTPTQPTAPGQRNRRRLLLDLKQDAGRAAVLRLVEHADVLFEGFRPGVMERLGLGPDLLLARNPRLVFGRMTGWGQHGPLAQAAGHDLNYIALAGALAGIGRTGEKPVPPLNLIGDFGGGGMLLAFGIVCALLEAQRSGRGQVVDAAMVDGAVALMSMFMGASALPESSCERPGTHPLSGAAHYYDTYETRDGKFISIAALEPQFYATLIDKLDLSRDEFGPFCATGKCGLDTDAWARLKDKLAALFLTRTRDEWCALLEGSDACFAPVLGLSEAPTHPHNRARQNFVDVAGSVQNAPAPRFSATPTQNPQPPLDSIADLEVLLRAWQLPGADIAAIIGAAKN